MAFFQAPFSKKVVKRDSPNIFQWSILFKKNQKKGENWGAWPWGKILLSEIGHTIDGLPRGGKGKTP